MKSTKQLQVKKSTLSFKASPGIAIIQEITDKDASSITLTQKAQGRIIKGKVISMGEFDTQHGEDIEPDRFCKEGDTVYFLHYFEEGGVDVGMIDGVKYYFVKWGDIRATQNG